MQAQENKITRFFPSNLGFFFKGQLGLPNVGTAVKMKAAMGPAEGCLRSRCYGWLERKEKESEAGLVGLASEGEEKVAGAALLGMAGEAEEMSVAAGAGDRGGWFDRRRGKGKGQRSRGG